MLGEPNPTNSSFSFTLHLTDSSFYRSTRSLRSLFSAAQPTQRKRRESHGEIPQSHIIDSYLAIEPQLPGIFTPNLPPELWSLIFRFSVDALFPPAPGSNSNAPSHLYPEESRHIVLEPYRPVLEGNGEDESPPHRYLFNGFVYQ